MPSVRTLDTCIVVRADRSMQMECMWADRGKGKVNEYICHTQKKRKGREC